VLDVDDTFDAAHGGQQLRLFNAYYDEYGFQPIVVFDGDGLLVGAVLRPARRPDGREIVTLLRRLIARIRSHWPRVEILLRGDSHYCTPEVLRFYRANRVDYALGVATTTTLRRHIETLEQSTTARFAAAGGPDKLRASRNSTTAPRAGIALNASSPASKLDPTVWTRASSPPTSMPVRLAPSMKRSIASAARRRGSGANCVFWDFKRQ
jgi:Transposase DDE domain group 1